MKRLALFTLATVFFIGCDDATQPVDDELAPAFSEVDDDEVDDDEVDDDELDEGDDEECVAPPPGLVSWWPGDGNGNDIVGSNDLTSFGDATFAAGKVDQAFSLDGDGDGFDVSDSPSLSLGNKDMTVVAWVNIAAKTGEGIVTKTGASSGTRRGDWDLRWMGTVDRFQFRVYRANGAPVGVVSADNLGSPQIGVWYFVAAWYDRLAGTVNIQVDNGPVDIVTAVGVAGDDVFPVRIGAWGDNGSPSLDGKVDEVQFFDRVLTSTEIQAEFLAGSAGKCKPEVDDDDDDDDDDIG